MSSDSLDVFMADSVDAFMAIAFPDLPPRSPPRVAYEVIEQEAVPEWRRAGVVPARRYEYDLAGNLLKSEPVMAPRCEVIFGFTQ